MPPARNGNEYLRATFCLEGKPFSLNEGGTLAPTTFRLPIPSTRLLLLQSARYDPPTVLSTNDPTGATINEFSGVFVYYANPENYLVESFPWI
jgi:hypothetical protein